MSNDIYDIAIIGGGIVGTATARTLLQQKSLKLILLEAESKLSAHQTGNNSGVVHSGLYYKPGSLKATNCVKGRESMYQFCEEHQIAYERCGKLVVATSEAEIPFLDALVQKGAANGLNGIKRLAKEEIAEYEPHCSGIDALHVPETGIVDYDAVVETFARQIKEKGGEIHLNEKVTGFYSQKNELILNTTQGVVKCKNLINCGGLQSDRIAKMCGKEPKLQIVPFRGEYYEIKKERQYLVKNLIYPVPDPQFPFLGVHFTRMVKGGVEAGPNAVLAFKREGYKKSDISLKDMLTYSSFPGFWRMGLKHWKMGIGEMYRSFSKKAFVKALQKLIPEIKEEDVVPGGAGVRAQALEYDGSLVDDFRILEDKNMIHVLNAPSPAATASISIGEFISQTAYNNFDL